MFADSVESNELYDLYINQKLSTYKIAEMLGVSQTTVRRKLKKLNLTNDMQRDSYNLNKKQEDLIVGSIFGDGCIDVNNDTASIVVAHSESQKDYCYEKMKVLQNIVNYEELKFRDRTKDKDSDNRENQYYFNTKYLKVLKSYSDIDNTCLISKLNINSITIWFLDDGSNNSPSTSSRGINNYYCIACYWLNEEELCQVINKIENDLHLKPVIDWYDKDRSKHKGIRFNVEDSKKLCDMMLNSDFGHMLKVTMSYKMIT